jgi:hypothetical protein
VELGIEREQPSFSIGDSPTLPEAIDEIERQFAASLAGAKPWPPATA